MLRESIPHKKKKLSGRFDHKSNQSLNDIAGDLISVYFSTFIHSFTPNLSQLNPNLSQLNPDLSQLNPNLSQLNPNLSQLNPKL